MLATWPAAGHAATWHVAVGESLAKVVRQAAEGDVIELQAGVHKGQTALVLQRQLTLRGQGGRAVLQADGPLTEDKAILVVRRGHVRLQNIEFRGARVPDRNGAGVRFEGGLLEVQQCAFVDNENGILTSNAADAELRVIDSEFADAPDQTPLPHLIYVGRIGRFVLQGSRLRGGQFGHLVKSRARVNEVRYNQLVDGPGGQAAYELEFPEGGHVTVVGNVIGQSATSSNPVLLSFGAEVQAESAKREHTLVLINNTLINEGWRPAVFVRVHEDKLDTNAAFKQRWVNNLFVGLGAAEPAWHDWALGNYAALRSSLRDADQGAYGLRTDSFLRGKGVGPQDLVAEPALVALLPKAEFTPPVGRRALQTPARWSPGAFQ